MWVRGFRKKVDESTEGCEDGLHCIEEYWVLPFVVIGAVLCRRYALLKPGPAETVREVSPWSGNEYDLTYNAPYIPPTLISKLRIPGGLFPSAFATVSPRAPALSLEASFLSNMAGIFSAFSEYPSRCTTPLDCEWISEGSRRIAGDFVRSMGEGRAN